MNENIKIKWIDALRSGEYAQGKSALHTKPTEGPETFCCLGVLCDLAVKAGVKVDVYDDKVLSLVLYDKLSAFLPSSVMKWADTEHVNVTREIDLTGMNDQGVPFTKIADEIEKHL